MYTVIPKIKYVGVKKIVVKHFAHSKTESRFFLIDEKRLT